MQSKLGYILGNQRNHAGVMRAWRNFAKKNLIALDKEFHPKNTVASQRASYDARDSLSLQQY